MSSLKTRAESLNITLDRASQEVVFGRNTPRTDGHIPCPVSGCDQPKFVTFGGLQKHVTTKHRSFTISAKFRERFIEFQKYTCNFPDCGLTYSSRGAYKSHCQAKHKRWNPFLSEEEQNRRRLSGGKSTNFTEETPKIKKPKNEPEEPMEATEPKPEPPKRIICPWSGCQHPPFATKELHRAHMKFHLPDLEEDVAAQVSAPESSEPELPMELRKRRHSEPKAPENSPEPQEAQQELEALPKPTQAKKALRQAPQGEGDREEMLDVLIRGFVEEDRPANYAPMPFLKPRTAPSLVQSVGEQARALFVKLDKKEQLSRRSHREEFCLPCLDFKLSTGKCENFHDDMGNMDRMQKFWLEEYRKNSTEELTKENVLDTLEHISNKWF